MLGTSPSNVARRFRRALTFTLVAATAACEQPTEPRSSRTPGAALADYKAIEKLLDSDGLMAVNALHGRTPMSASAIIGVARALPGLAEAPNGRQYLADLFRAAATAHRGVTAEKVIISDQHLGKTLTYSAPQDRYVLDPSRTGAPANGVRFIAYELDAAGKPISTRETGYADLLDEGATTGDAIALRLRVVIRGTTLLDYRTRVEFSETAGSIDVSGFATDGSGRLDFTVAVDARKAGSRTLIDADFELGVSARRFSVTGRVRGVEEGRDGEGDITLTARHQENTLRVAVAGDGGTLDGTISWNGSNFVTISGSAAAPTLRGPSGQPLTLEEQLVVRSVMRLADDVFDLVEELVEPVEDLVLLGWIL